MTNTPITFDIETRTPDERRGWYEDHTTGPGHRLLVAVEGTHVVGYAGCGTFRAKRAYETTVETTIYLDQAATALGRPPDTFRDTVPSRRL